MADGKVTYFKDGDGFVMNTHYKDGEELPLHPKQAKYLLPPLGTELRTTAKAAAAPVKAKAPTPAPTPAKKNDAPAGN